MKSFLVLFAPFFLNYALAIANSARPSAGQGLDVHILPSHPHRSKSSKRQIVWRIQIMDRFDEHDKYHCIVGGDVAVPCAYVSDLMESHVIQELQRIGQIVDAAKDVNLRQNRFVDAVRVRNLETRQDQEGQRESQEQNQQGNQDWKSNPTLKAELVATSMS